MLVIGAFFSVILYVAVFFTYLRKLDNRFVSAGFPKGTFYNYVMSEYIWIPLSGILVCPLILSLLHYFA